MRDADAVCPCWCVVFPCCGALVSDNVHLAAVSLLASVNYLISIPSNAFLVLDGRSDFLFGVVYFEMLYLLSLNF